MSSAQENEVAVSRPTIPPVAERVAHQHIYHGKEMPTDYYHWLKHQKDEKPKEIIDYLTAENTFYAEQVKPLENSSQTIYEEILSRIKETDSSVPVYRAPWYYFRNTVKGLDYPIYYRSANSDLSEAQVLLDQNLEKHEYQSLGDFTVSPDHKLLAYSLDLDGSENYSIFVKDLTTNELLPDRIVKASESIEWSADSSCLYYTILDHIHRPFKMLRHVLGQDSATQDVLLYHEPDEKFILSIGKSNSGAYLFVTLSSSLTTEIRYLDAAIVDEEPRLFKARETGVKYYVENQGDRFLIMTNGGGEFLNFKLMSCPVKDISKWTDVLPYDPLVHLEDVQPFHNFIALFERSNATTRIRILSTESGQLETISFPVEVHTVSAIGLSQQNYESDVLRFSYSSILENAKIIEFCQTTKAQVVLKETEIPSPEFDSANYTVKRVFVPIPKERQVSAPWNTPVPEAIPMTIIYKTSLFKGDGSNPCLLYGYGSYGISIDPSFSSSRFSLVDRGFVYAIGHIRGGGENGRGWYECGKFHHKPNTFHDFIACADFLKAEKYTSTDGLAIEGRSAGGLLMGAVLNMRPDLCKLAVAGVPFVDVINTMMDESIPLTVNEYEEWGDPNEEAYFKTMLSYSPYDNVDPSAPYPILLVKAGLTDPRVAYWEPAKWCALLRHYQRKRQLVEETKPENLIAFECKMGSGHFGSSGRYAYYKEVAADYAFVIHHIQQSLQKSE